MHPVPRELEQARPRDPANAKVVSTGGDIPLIGAALVASLMLPGLVFRNVLIREEAFDAVEPSMILGYVVTLLAAIGVAMLFLRRQRIRAIYRDGILTEASIDALRFEPAGPSEKRATMDLRYPAAGQERRARVAIVGVLSEAVVSQGGTVMILVDPRAPERIGVYTPMTGLVIPRRA
jgi:hypothetical protein